MKILQFGKHTFKFSTTPQPFAQFLSNKQSSLQAKRGTTRSISGLDISVPRIPISREAVTEFMIKKDIKSKNVLVNIDGSHIMGMKRLLCKNHLNKNVYKGHGEPVDILAKSNPVQFTKVQELIFDQHIFSNTDPYFLEKVEVNNKNQSLLQQITQLYDKDPERGGKRLLAEYSVPPEFIPIVEAAHNLNNVIYFVGLNQYDIREIVAAYLSISEVKMFFMECLNYVFSQGLAQSQLESHFRFKSKEFLWKQHYNLLQPINFQQLNTFKRKVKGYNFAHSYNFITPDNPNINFQRLKDTQPDSTKLQKHAMLSVLFGNIWTQPYSNNPFPYLAQHYHKLSVDDKQAVIQIYNKHFQRYSAAKTKFFEQRYQAKTAN